MTTPKMKTPDARRRGSAMLLAVTMVTLLLVLGLGYVSLANLHRISGGAAGRASTTDTSIRVATDVVSQRITQDMMAYLEPSTSSDPALWHRYITYPDGNHDWLSPILPEDSNLAADGADADAILNNDWDYWRQTSSVLPGPALDLSLMSPPTLAASPAPFDQITRIAVTNGGSGYTSAPTVTIAGGAAAVAVVDPTSQSVIRVDITNPGSGYLQGSNPAVSFAGGGGSGAEAVAQVTSMPFVLVGSANENYLADTNGDGYADAYYYELSIPGTNGIRWVMASRIIDESGLLNVNTGTETEHSGSRSSMSRVFGDTPADVNLKRFLASFDATAGNNWASYSYASPDGNHPLRGIGYEIAAPFGSVGDSGTMRLLYRQLGYQSGMVYPTPPYSTPLLDVERATFGSMSSRMDVPSHAFTPFGSDDQAKLRLYTSLNSPAASFLDSIIDGNPTSGFPLSGDDIIASPFSGGGGTGGGIKVYYTGIVSHLGVTTPGSNYVKPPWVEIVGGGGSGAKAVAILEEGRVAAIRITNPGEGYTTEPTVNINTQPFDPGSGCTVDYSVNPYDIKITGIIQRVEVTPNGGSGYTTPPKVNLTSLSGFGGNAVATIDGAGEVSGVYLTGGVLRSRRVEGPAFGAAPLAVNQLRSDRRRLLTTFNGARNLRQRWASPVLAGTAIPYTRPTVTGAPGDFKLPLNPPEPIATSIVDYRNVFFDVLSQAMVSGDTYESAATASGATPRAADAAAAMAANLLAKRAPDVYNPLPSQHIVGGNEFYGQKLQPFFREVCATMIYQDLSDNALDPPPLDAAANSDVDPVNVADERGKLLLMVELSNPFPVAVDTRNFYLRIKYNSAAPAGADTDGDLQLGPNYDAAGSFMQPHERLVLYSDATSGAPVDFITTIQAGGGGTNALEVSANKRKGLNMSWPLPLITNPGDQRPDLTIELIYKTAVSTPIVVVDRIEPPTSPTPWRPVVPENGMFPFNVATDKGYAIKSESLQRDDQAATVPTSVVGRVEVTFAGGGYAAGTGWSTTPTVTFSGGGATRQARGLAYLQNNRVVAVAVIDSGEGYTGTPTIQIGAGGPTDATAVAYRDPGFARYIFEDPAANVLEKLVPVDTNPPQASPFGTIPVPLQHKMAPTTAWTNTANYGAVPPYQLPYDIGDQGGVAGATMQAGGTGYTGDATIAIAGTGTGAEAVPILAVGTVDGTAGVAYVAGIRITNPGTGYTAPPTVTITPSAGSGATVMGGVANLAGFGVVDATVAVGGSNFNAPVNVHFGAGGGGGAEGYAVVTAGALSKVIITNPGFGFDGSAINVRITDASGAGSGATITPVLARTFRNVSEMGMLMTYAHKKIGANWVPISRQLGDATYGGGRTLLDNGRPRGLEFVRSVAPALPVVLALYDQFTTLSGSPSNNSMVYGLINLNTAPPEVIATLPYMLQGSVGNSSAVAGGPAPAWDLARTIVSYRDKLTSPVDFSNRANTSGVTGLRSEPGIASLGELLAVRTTPALAAANPTWPNILMTRAAADAGDNHLDGSDSALADNSPSPGARDTTVNDLEEEMLHFQAISNLVTLRSDVFTAHVVLQGRRFDPVGGTWVKAVQRRFVVTFDRSNIGAPQSGVDGESNGGTTFTTHGVAPDPTTTRISIDGIGERTVTAVNPVTGQLTLSAAVAAGRGYRWTTDKVAATTPRVVMFAEER